MDNDYRCTETIDLEEIIEMQNEKDFKNVKAVATYQSGRTEEFHGKLNKNQLPAKVFQKRVADLKAFPTVEKVEVTKY